MREIKITTQAELDALPDSFSEYTIISIRAKVRIIINKARGNSSVVARGNSSVVAWENSSVVAWGNSSVVAWGNSSVEAWENSSVEARGNSSVVAWGNSSVVARGNVACWLYHYANAVLNGWSVAFKLSVSAIVEIKSTNAVVQDRSDGKREPYLEREGVEELDGLVTLFKKVSADYKTQENTDNETKWPIGATVTHPNWEPNKSECGAGKFHACSRPYFCDEFRNEKGDRYIAIQIKVADLYEWPGEQSYPHKIAFREGLVIGECDRFGKMKQ